MHQQLVNLNTRLHDIEQARIHGEVIASVQARLDREAAIDDLATETKNVMIAAGRSSLQSKMEEPQSFDTPQIIGKVADSLLPAPEAQLWSGSSSQGERPVSPSMTPSTPLAQCPLLYTD
jgi:hypothetical protein